MASAIEQLSNWDTRQHYMEKQADVALVESLAGAAIAVGGIAYYQLTHRKRGAVIATTGLTIAINRFKAFDSYEKQAEIAGHTHMQVTNMLQEQLAVEPIAVEAA